ncbi:MAG: homoserine dehydrogenase [Actinomycetota bacterium]|nr:homoserine dehydrogenase [Actinomycetota bacterium]
MAEIAQDRAVRVAVLGCGTVGRALVGLLLDDAAGIAERSGVRLALVGVAVADPTKHRVGVPAELITGDAKVLVTDPEVDVVVELIGGLDPARELVEAALAAGKAVVTANKALVAAHGASLAATASAAGVDLLYEAAVAGAIPIIRPLRESLAGERVQRVTGIVNGTTNFILTLMAEEGVSYEDALGEAQRLGYAERDPSADVDGHDAAAKAAILAGLAFRCAVVGDDVPRQGIGAIPAADVASAARMGFVVKLLAVAELVADGALSVRVHPSLVPAAHPLASVRGAFNAVFVEGEACGELMLYGRGAGGMPTASAVLGDVIDAAHNRLSNSAAPAPPRGPARLLPPSEVRCPYYLSVEVADQPGVLAAVATAFGRHQVSIRSMEQDGLGEEARLIFLTHTARDGDVQATLAELADLPAVRRVGAVLRVVGVVDEPSAAAVDRPGGAGAVLA